MQKRLSQTNYTFKDWLEFDESPEGRGVVREKGDKPGGLVLPKQENKLSVLLEGGQTSQRLLRVEYEEDGKGPLNLLTWDD